MLGTAQDGGLPHVGCHRAPCERARHDPTFARHVVSLAIVDHAAGRRFLVEATPDSAGPAGPAGRPRPRARGAQSRRRRAATHAHVGHYSGLIHFGREVASTQRLPLYASARMLDFLRHAGPWKLLFDLEQVEAHELVEGAPTRLTDRVAVTSLRVPHRDEFSDTLALRIDGPGRSLLFVPDTDRWATWARPIEELVRGADVALLDGTFHAAGELPGRNPAEVPHPLVIDTMARLAQQSAKVIFIHLNHTNPLCDPDSPESRAARKAGFRIAEEGMRIPL